MGKLHKILAFFRAITSDKTANTIAISAASLVPLMAMVGGGVDASRYYMTETRLQAACDAGALAARRAMDDDDFTSEHRQIGLNFFDQNYPDGTFGLEDLSRNYTADEDGTVTGTASGELPTSIMGAFGYDQFDLTVSCEAEINISNTDIVFVLDVTGSMNCQADDEDCGNNGNVEDTNSKIDNLRDSALLFYDTVDSATSASAQVRYGIVPYSNEVNVGASLDPTWMVTSHTYQSREADWDITIEYEVQSTSYQRTSGASNWRYQNEDTQTTYGISYDDCVDMASTYYDVYHSSNQNTWTQTSQSGSSPRTTTYSGTVTYKYYGYKEGSYRSSDGRCRLKFDYWLYDATSTITETEGEVETREFYWVYRPVTWNVSDVYTNGSVSLPTGWEEANETHTWNGCIEEADTTTDTVWDPVPSGAYDLDIDLVPDTDAERWRPSLRSLVFYRYASNGNKTTSERTTTTDWSNPTDYCPKAARKLAPFADRDELEDYLAETPPAGSGETEGFRARGATYHDHGMIWGARFITPDGIFASENATAPNGDAISRHIIFMTDGEQSTSNTVYNLYGIEWWDRRVSGDGSSTTISNNHAARFQAACKAARNKNISVWVVAFGTSLTQNLIDCATPGRAFHADDADELDDRFREIAEKIAALRLTA